MQPYENWKVVKKSNSNKHFCFYGSEEEIASYIDEDFGLDNVSYEFIPQYNWTAEDWAEVCENELESANRHSFTSFPCNFLCSLRNYEHSDEACAEIMRLFALDIWDCI